MNIFSLLLPFAGLIAAPLLPGLINRVKAFFAGRRGPSIFQLYYDIAKLLRKEQVYSKTTGLAARLAPPVVLGTAVIALLIIPWGSLTAPVSFAGDMILLFYLLGTARFAMVLGALDTGSSFEGMGASREVQFAALVEPSLFLGMLVLALHSGSAGLSGIFAEVPFGKTNFGYAPLLLVACAWFVALLAENARIPVDDPNTHLELTMIHEVMILDAGGPDFGLLLYASALKLWIFCALVANLFVPAQGVPDWTQAPLFTLGIMLTAVVIGIIESITARLRLRLVPKLLIGAGAVSAIALIFTVLTERL